MSLLFDKKIINLIFIYLFITFDFFSLQLGNGNKENQLYPIKILDNVKQVSSNVSYSMIIKTDNTLWATGSNKFGQFGIKDNVETDEYIFIMDEIKFVETSIDYSLIIKSDNSLWISGYYPAEKNDKGKIIWKKTNYFKKIADNVKTVSAGRRHILFINNEDILFGLGDNTFGQLGLGDSRGVLKPHKLQKKVQNIFANNYYSYFIDYKNDLYISGDKTFFFDSNNNEIKSNSFTKISENVRDISVGFILKTDDTLYSFGFGCYGALGIGKKGSEKERVSLVYENVQTVSSNNEHSLILLKDNTLLSCGGGSDFNYGSIGNGTKLASYEPQKIMDNVKSFSVGDYYSLIILADNTLWGFGLNNANETGVGL